MKAVIDNSGNVLARGWVDYVIPDDENWEVIEFEPDEWPTISCWGEDIGVDRKDDVKWNKGLNSFEIKPQNRDSIFEGIKFYGKKRLEYKERDDGVDLTQEKLDVDNLVIVGNDMAAAMLNLHNKVMDGLSKVKKVERRDLISGK